MHLNRRFETQKYGNGAIANSLMSGIIKTSASKYFKGLMTGVLAMLMLASCSTMRNQNGYSSRVYTNSALSKKGRGNLNLQPYYKVMKFAERN